jgi:hypothetical protein
MYVDCVCRPYDKTTLPHRQGEEPTIKGASMITIPIYLELHTHKHPCCCAINPERLHTVVFGGLDDSPQAKY